MNQILAEMDGFSPHESVVVTNNRHKLEALADELLKHESLIRDEVDKILTSSEETVNLRRQGTEVRYQKAEGGGRKGNWNDKA